MKKFAMFITMMLAITSLFAKIQIEQLEQREFADGLGVLKIHRYKESDYHCISIEPNLENFNKFYDQYPVVAIIFNNLDEAKLFEKSILSPLETFCNSNDWDLPHTVEDLSPEERFLNIGDLLANTEFMYPIFVLLAPELDQTKFELNEIEDTELGYGMTCRQYYFFYDF